MAPEKRDVVRNRALMGEIRQGLRQLEGKGRRFTFEEVFGEPFETEQTSEMIRYRIEIPRVLRDLIHHIPPELKAKVKAALRSISDDPYRAKEYEGRKVELAKLPGSQVPESLSYAS